MWRCAFVLKCVWFSLHECVTPRHGPVIYYRPEGEGGGGWRILDGSYVFQGERIGISRR